MIFSIFFALGIMVMVAVFYARLLMKRVITILKLRHPDLYKKLGETSVTGRGVSGQSSIGHKEYDSPGTLSLISAMVRRKLELSTDPELTLLTKRLRIVWISAVIMLIIALTFLGASLLLDSKAGQL